jgi:hypothetical protein
MFSKDEADCPLWRAPCRKEKCRWWVHVTGKHPQTEEYIDRANCAIAWMPWLQVETTQMMRHATASTDKVANEIGKNRQQNSSSVEQVIRGVMEAVRHDVSLPAPNGYRLIEDRGDD